MKETHELIDMFKKCLKDGKIDLDAAGSFLAEVRDSGLSLEDFLLDVTHHYYWN